MNSFERGRAAEQAVVAYLVRQGCTILATNWRTRRCEIDVIAFRDDTVFCCEVKYRTTVTYGSGIEYVTPQKLRQMHFAAQSWAHMHAWHGLLELVAIEVTGSDMRITRVEKDLR